MFDKKRVYIHQFQAASSKNMLPLAAGMLASYAKSVPEINNEFEVEIVILRQDPKDIVQMYQAPDVLAFSCYSWNFQQSLEVARLAKSVNPHCLVVFGGPMISDNTMQLSKFFKSYSFIDVTVSGIGEWVFKEILLARINNRSLQGVSGIAIRNLDAPDGFVFHAHPVFEHNLDELPSPFLDSTFDDILRKYPDEISGALWETNRGCPYRCSFCVQGGSSLSKVIDFNQSRLFQEFEWISKNKISYVFCCDANFGIRKRDIKITQRISELSRKYGYPKSFVVNWVKNSSEKVIEIIDELWKGGLPTRLTLSIQSFHPETLLAVNRKNIQLSMFEDLIAMCAKRGIYTYTELILGLPQDTYKSIRSSVGNCLSRKLTYFFIVYLCRLLSGTKMAEPEFCKKYGIKVKPCRIGLTRHENFSSGIDEFENIIVETNTLPVSDWVKAHRFICMALVLYNFRLAFFILNFLRQEYGIDISDCIDCVIENKNQASVISRALKIIKEGQESVLSGKGSYLVPLDFTGKILYEIHEAALLVFLKEIDNFYRELEIAISKYLKEKNISLDPLLLKELFIYQGMRIPSFAKKTQTTSFTFNYNLPEYFQALCDDDRPIVLRKQDSRINIPGYACTDEPVDFIRKRLTITSYEINEVQYANTMATMNYEEKKV